MSRFMGKKVRSPRVTPVQSSAIASSRSGASKGTQRNKSPRRSVMGFDHNVASSSGQSSPYGEIRVDITKARGFGEDKSVAVRVLLGGIQIMESPWSLKGEPVEWEEVLQASGDLVDKSTIITIIAYVKSGRRKTRTASTEIDSRKLTSMLNRGKSMLARWFVLEPVDAQTPRYSERGMEVFLKLVYTPGKFDGFDNEVETRRSVILNQPLPKLATSLTKELDKTKGKRSRRITLGKRDSLLLSSTDTTTLDQLLDSSRKWTRGALHQSMGSPLGKPLPARPPEVNSDEDKEYDHVQIGVMPPLPPPRVSRRELRNYGREISSSSEDEIVDLNKGGYKSIDSSVGGYKAIDSESIESYGGGYKAIDSGSIQSYGGGYKAIDSESVQSYGGGYKAIDSESIQSYGGGYKAIDSESIQSSGGGYKAIDTQRMVMKAYPHSGDVDDDGEDSSDGGGYKAIDASSMNLEELLEDSEELPVREKDGELPGFSLDDLLDSSPNISNIDNDKQGAYRTLDFSSDDEEEPISSRGKGGYRELLEAQVSELVRESGTEARLTMGTPEKRKKRAPKPTKKVRDWREQDAFNSRFQDAVEQLQLNSVQSNTRRQELLQSRLNVIQLAQDFATTASHYGKTIISEHNLPMHKRTIQPAQGLGGVLGGEKYLVGGILFKFADDPEGVFDSLDDPLWAANKVGGHELKGLKAYFSTRMPGMHFPLMALVDYKGYRLVAMSRLPISHDTMCYGSNDAGKTFCMTDPELAQMITDGSQMLNLKRHMVGPKGREVEISSPCDLEGHLGWDGRYYLLDFSRTFPPVHTGKKGVPDHLYRLFRPEFLREYEHALSSDATSHFGRHNHKVHDREIYDATKDLLSQHIPKVARLLIVEAEKHQHDLTQFSLTEVLHRNGVNMRYLGLVYNLSQTMYTECQLGELILIEMFARVIKNYLRRLLRTELKGLTEPSEAPFNNLILKQYNILFGQCVETHDIWTQYIPKQLKENFSMDADLGELDTVLRSMVFRVKGRSVPGKWVLLDRVSRMVGVDLSPDLMIQLRDEPKMFERASLLDYLDIIGLSERVKFISVVNQAKGDFFLLKALMRHNDSSAIEYMIKAEKCLEEALKSTPTDPQLLVSLGNILFEHAKKLAARHASQIGSNSPSPADLGRSNSSFRLFGSNKSSLHRNLSMSGTLTPGRGDEEAFESDDEYKSHMYITRAKQYYLSGLKYDPSNDLFLRSYAIFLEYIKDEMGAQDYYLRCLNSNPNSLEGLRRYGAFLKTVDQHEAAEPFFERYKQICESLRKDLAQ